jgi:hypothetical protein
VLLQFLASLAAGISSPLLALPLDSKLSTAFASFCAASGLTVAVDVGVVVGVCVGGFVTGGEDETGEVGGDVEVTG